MSAAQRLRTLLDAGDIVVAPGAPDALTARLVGLPFHQRLGDDYGR